LGRIESVDVFRLFAIIAVIAIHTRPFHGQPTPNPTFWNLEVLVNQLARFAVPFFFVISGYFWGRKIRNGNSISSTSLPMAKRLLVIFVAWSALYCLPYNISSMAKYGPFGPIKLVYWNLCILFKHPLRLVMAGTKDHLWFLMGLVCAIGIASIFVKKKWNISLILLSIALYLLGVLAKAYSNTPLGITTDFNTRYGPFFSTVLFVSGYYLSGFSPNPSWFFKGVAILVFGWVMHFSELYFLWKQYGTDPYQEYVLGTYFMGMGAAITSLSNPPWLRSTTLSEIGKFTLGIYAIHLAFVDLLKPVDELTDSRLWQFAYLLLVFYLSLATVRFMSQYALTKKIVA
jgi:surface polysaccharide O-acyltransferase-like enzyme